MYQSKGVDDRVKSILNQELELISNFSKLLRESDLINPKRIPGGGSGSPEDGRTALILYIVAAVIIGAGLLFYCKWSHAKWKKRNKKYNERLTRPATMVAPVEITEIPLENLSTFAQPPAYADIEISQIVEYESRLNRIPRGVDGTISMAEHSDLPPPYETVLVPEVTASTL